MGRFYMASLKGKLTRRLIISLISSILFLFSVTLAAIIYVQIKLIAQNVNDSNQIEVARYQSSILGKTGAINQIYQLICNELQIIKLNLQRVNNGQYQQSPPEQQERSQYYFYHDVINKPNQYRPLMQTEISFCQQYPLKGKTGQIRFDKDVTEYAHLSESQRNSLWDASGLDFISYPYGLNSGRKAFHNGHVSFSDALSYYFPGTIADVDFEVASLGESLYDATYPDCQA